MGDQVATRPAWGAGQGELDYPFGSDPNALSGDPNNFQNKLEDFCCKLLHVQNKNRGV